MSRVILHPGSDDDDDSWMPEITLEHDSKLNEMYVICGEEAAGMIEHISSYQFEQIRKRLYLAYLVEGE